MERYGKYVMVVIVLVMLSLALCTQVLAAPPAPDIPDPIAEPINEWAAGFGLSAFVMTVVEMLKRLGWLKDGTAGRWASLGNLLGFGILMVVGVFGVDIHGDAVHSIVEILTALAQLALMIVGAPFIHARLRSARVLRPMKNRKNVIQE
ncbi:MAG: hypothetical protein DRJ03_08855 [Chloroflexi bacterium]|nr:MAG: hypothetical protein DRI81_00650 [Chloroflexota bacterium]RLC86417.1 MAG: hypothetical protein DRJ03_08855 [Chloroflexota bacterium]